MKISDTGIGIPREELKHTFDAFSQGDHAVAHRLGGQAGPGDITKKIIELHSGCIHADSKGPGQGAIFTIELPLWPNEDENVVTKQMCPPV